MDSEKKPVPPSLIFGHYHVIPEDVRMRLMSVKPTIRVMVLPDMHIGSAHQTSPLELLERLKRLAHENKLSVILSRGDSMEDFEATRKS